jgi:hypothetical protein
MTDRFVHVHLPPNHDPLALTSALVRWLEETYHGDVNMEEAVREETDIEVLIRIRYDAVGVDDVVTVEDAADESLTA